MQAGLREQRAQAPNERRGHPAAGRRQYAQLRRRLGRPVRLGELDPQRGHARQHGDVMPPDRLHHVARDQIVERHRARARRPARQQLVEPGVEAQRQHGERAVFAGQSEIMRHRDRAEPEVGVAQHHALGLAGRSRGVEQGGERIGVAGRGRQRRDMRPGQFRFQQQSAVRRPILRLEQGGARRLGDEQPRAAVRQNVRDLRALEQRVDRNMHQPRPRARQREQARGARLGQPARDPVARRGTLGEVRGERPHRRIEPGEIERSGPIDQRDIARPPTQHEPIEPLRRRVRPIR